MGVSRDCPFFWIPTIISRTRKAMASIFTGPSEQKPIKNFGKKGAWAYPGTAPIVWVTPNYLDQEWVKLRTSNFMA